MISCERAVEGGLTMGDDSELIWQEIGINNQHVCESGGEGRYQLICDKAWLQALEKQRKLTPFPTWPQLDRRAHPTGQLEHPWTRILVQTYRKQVQRKVYPLPRSSGVGSGGGAGETLPDLPLSYSQAVAYVANTNFKQLWEQAYDQYKGAHVKLCRGTGSMSTKVGQSGGLQPQQLQPHDVVLKELIQRIYLCPVLRITGMVGGGDVSSIQEVASDCHANIMPALVAIESSTHFTVFFYPPAMVCSLYDCITYSPALLGKSYNKTLFLIYQILQLSKHLQGQGFFLGDLRLQHIVLRENLWLQVLPRLETNLLVDAQEAGAEMDMSPLSPLDTPVSMGPGDQVHPFSSPSMFDLKLAYDPAQFNLREYTEMWCNGQLSNFDYLTILNNACGRSLTNASHHHIMPWVTDFAGRNGSNWRDLTKSKYRLNKGDIHLDLMFNQANNHQSGLESPGSEQVPHHVSDFLSEITYFVYMARRTPQAILCAHVRPIWVPAEYPVSIQRLQEWTPDECIPEFYSDPMIFKSIHEDLPDLELPSWATCPEDFIAKHREALESQYVSERLNHWIDLNFGYKLSGKPAVKSKNVCLSLVDQHRNLSQRGIVQLFSQAHPPRRYASPWFNKTAPRLSQLYGKSSKRLAKSSENLHVDQPSTSNSSSPRMSLRPPYSDHSDGLHSGSNFYSMTNFIELPDHYNPALLLQNLESLESFYAKTFPQQRPTVNPEEKIISSDLLFEQNSADHSFTNQLFAGESSDLAMSSSKKSKNLLKEQKKNCLQELLGQMRERELQVLGCLIVEMFAMSRLRPLLMGNGPTASFESRLAACRSVAQLQRQELPKPVRHVVRILLQLNPKDGIEQGLPQPCHPGQLVEPMFANFLVPFPSHYIAVYALVKSLHSFELNATLLELHTHFSCEGGRECSRYTEIDRQRVLFDRKIGECKVMSCCAYVRRLLEPIVFAYEQFTPVELILPHIIDLLRDERTSILTAWNLFDPIAQALGITQTQQHLLQPLLKLYDVEGSNPTEDCPNSNGGSGHLRFSSSSSFKSRKSVKLYHHSFLLRLIVRFGLRCFLQHFIPPLIEAVGGYKEPEQGNGFHYHSGGSRRTSKNLNFAAVEEETDPEMPTNQELKPDIEELFTFEEDQDRISNQETKSIDSFDMRQPTASAAEEARESEDDDKLVINDIIYGSKISLERLSLKGVDTQTPPQNLGPRSPTIEIPSMASGGIRRSFQLSAIDCDIGSRKSVDSFELISQAVQQEQEQEQQQSQVPQTPEACDSLQASVISRMSEAKALQNNRISEMSAESLVWLSHRLGPVLTSRYITRNLLKLLSLCYVGQENLLPEMEDNAGSSSASASSSPDAGNLNYFSIANARVVGDRSAARVLECLMSIAALYGENFLLFQYFPHISELIALCSKRITGSLEGAIISSLQLLKFMVPCLTDVTIMEHLQHILLDSILLPILRLLSSTNLLMPSGYLGRSLLARKFLDAIYALSVRLGSDMSREHLCQSLLCPFFLIFNKAFGLPNDFSYNLANLSLSSGQQERALEELRDVFGPELAHTSYLAFLRFLGEAIMQRTLTNLEFILTLCHEHEQPGQNKSSQVTNVIPGQGEDVMDATCELAANSFGTQIVGNRLQVSSSSMELLDMVAYKLDQLPSSRHLKGNWLAYWRHETTRSEKDNQTLNLKQIRLQSFVGHTNSVRAIYALDNENSFISASKDKTVKLWSLRSEGDGRKTSTCQFTYTCHKKSIHSLSFLDSLRYVISCDSGVHIWDPFIGRPLGILDAPKFSAVTVVKCLPSHSPLVVAGTAESTVKIIDCRSMQYVNEWRVCNSALPNATIRCLAVAPSGNWLAAGLSTGGIVQLDTRTGTVLNSWRPMECDQLQLTAPSDQLLVSSALDHSLAVWHALDGIMHYQLKPPPEPAHFLQSVGSSLVYATTGNRVGVYADVANSHALNSVTKLRSETFRGVLTSLAVLPLNRAFLAGNESGNIALLC